MRRELSEIEGLSEFSGHEGWGGGCAVGIFDKGVGLVVLWPEAA
jgi:hypothetical protein